MEITGLIPAGGIASRLGKLPFSKEVIPVTGKNRKPEVLSGNLIRYFKVAGINNLYFIIRKGKWDIPGYFGDGSEFGVNMGYLMMNEPYGTPFTINQAYPFIKDKMVALGFPDIIFEPENAFLLLKNAYLKSDADIILGIVPSKQYLISDMIEFDNRGKISNIIIKQNRPDLQYSWFIAIWRPSFSLFMKNFLQECLIKDPDGKMHLPDGTTREIYVGDVIYNSIAAGMNVDYHIFSKGHYRDLGTWEEWHNLSAEG